MAKDSKYNIEKEQSQRNKYRAVLSELPPFVNDFLNNKEKKNVNTALAYAQDLLVFFKYLQEFSPLVKDKRIRDVEIDIIEKLSYRDINEYQDFLSIKHNELSDEYNNNIRGIARKMSALRGLCKYLLVHHEIESDPTAGADDTKVNFNDHEIVRMNVSEVNQLLQTVLDGIGTERQKAYLERTKKRDYAILYLLLNTGLRVSECVGLDVKDINFNENSIKVYRKGKKENILYFDDDLADILLDYLHNERDNYTETDKEQAFFLSTRKTRLSTRSVQQLVEKYAGIAVSNKNITPHKLRSTYGTALYNQTGDIRLVADVLGHSSVNTTAKYYAAVEDANRRKAAQIKPYKTNNK
ncbi:MAG: tyrosine-type recombinase/integrase [Erysipelotrichaceae bacterium]|nr:tyrosine-type recombinase/integrase [Erysipelotrichaceae bacterium]